MSEEPATKVELVELPINRIDELNALAKQVDEAKTTQETQQAMFALIRLCYPALVEADLGTWKLSVLAPMMIEAVRLHNLPAVIRKNLEALAADTGR